MGMDILFKRYIFIYISRLGLVLDFNFIRSFFCEVIEVMKIFIFLSFCVIFVWVSIFFEDFLIFLYLNYLYELFFVVFRVV